MAIENGQSYEITSGGGTITIDVTQPIPDFIGLYSTTTFSLLGNWSLEFSATPPVGTKITVGIQLQSVTLNSHTIEIFGSALSQIELRVGGGCYELHYFGGLLIWVNAPVPSQNNSISGYAIDAMPTDRISGMTSAQIIVADGSDVAQAVDMSGDVTIDASGVTAIGSGKVTNTQLAGSIARTKLASGTAYRVLTNNGEGAYTELAQLTAKLGGLGIDNSGATGFVTFNAGTASVNVFTDTNHVNVSFETGYVGDFKVKMGFAGTVTSAYAFLTKTIGAVDAVITIKNNAGTTMGSITFTASDAKGTAQTVAISANNTFSAGDVLTFTTSGGSTTGEALVSYSFTRNS
jgi:hypothetical protein